MQGEVLQQPIPREKNKISNAFWKTLTKHRRSMRAEPMTSLLLQYGEI